MFKNLDLLSVRSLTIAAAVALVISVLGMCLTMLRPRDSLGLARNSFGTQSHGYRALFEILEELEVAVSRSTAPPQPAAADQHTLVILNPNADLVAVGPKYVHALPEWVEAGGRLVVTPSLPAQHQFGQGAAPNSDDESSVDILEAIGVDEQVSAGEWSEEVIEEDFKKGRENWEFWGRTSAPPPRVAEATLTGSLAQYSDDIRRLAVPGQGFRTLNAKPENLDGSILSTDQDGKPQLIVAVLRRGAGEIVVVSDPELLTNRLIAEADNSVLAAHLIAPGRRDVVIDEFYHGLAVRGNPLYLLTRPGFAAVAFGIILVVGTYMWRSAVYLGPPLADSQVKRRDIREYVGAMVEFFSRGRDSRRFVVREVRDGVLRQICHDLRLPMDTLDLDTIASALARRDQGRAARLTAAIRDVDAVLAQPGEFPRHDYLPVMQRLTNCL